MNILVWILLGFFIFAASKSVGLSVFLAAVGCYISSRVIRYFSPEQRASRAAASQQFERDARARAEQRETTFRAATIDALSRWIADHSLTCAHCSALAAPVLDTTNRYRCPSCGRQFSAAAHHAPTATPEIANQQYWALDEAGLEPLGETADGISDPESQVPQLYSEALKRRNSNARSA